MSPEDYKFISRSQGQEWFAKAADYLMARRSVIQMRLQNTFRFAELCKENGSTFSYEFASILRDSGSVFGSVLDSLVKGRKGDFALRTDIAQYRDFLIAVDPDICRRSVQVRRLFPQGRIVPLSELSQKGGPGWWQAFNNVKHSEYDNLHDGNLRNAVLSVAALVILEHFAGASLAADNLWMNIGQAHSINTGAERYLFSDRANAEASSQDHAPTAIEATSSDKGPAVAE